MYGEVLCSLSPGCRAKTVLFTVKRLEVRLLGRLTELNLELSLLCVPVSIVATLGIPLVQVKAGVLYSLEGKLTSLRQRACSSQELSGELNGKTHQ